MPLSQEDKEKMLELAAMGYSNEAIATRYGLSHQYVSQVLTGFKDRAAESRAEIAKRHQPGGGEPRTRAKATPRTVEDARSEPVRTQEPPKAKERKAAPRRTTA